VAMRAFEKAAKAKRVRPETLITVKAPKIEAKPGFFAHLFAKKPEVVKAKEAPKVSVLDAVSKPIAPVAKPVTPVSVAKSAVAEVKPVVQEVKKVEPVKAVPAKVEPKKESKPGFFAKLFAKKPEVVKAKEAPKVVALKPVLAKPAVAEVKPVVKTVVVEVAKPVAKPVVQEVKKAEPVKAAPAKVEPKKESKPGFFAKLFASAPAIFGCSEIQYIGQHAGHKAHGTLKRGSCPISSDEIRGFDFEAACCASRGAKACDRVEARGGGNGGAQARILYFRIAVRQERGAQGRGSCAQACDAIAGYACHPDP